MDRKTVTEFFQRYTDRYNPEDPKIRLKIHHTYRVAGICDRIAGSLSLSGEDRDLAWVLGMLHDIGRFEQVRRFGNFQDNEKVNHALLGADILFSQGEIEHCSIPREWYPLTEKAIRLHNAFRLPEDLTEREQLFCDLIRDADKVDIFRVNMEIPHEDIYGTNEEKMRRQPITDKVFESLMRGENVLKSDRKTEADIYVSHIALVFGLVYPESFRIVREQGYLEKMLSFESELPEARERIRLLREKVTERMLAASLGPGRKEDVSRS